MDQAGGESVTSLDAVRYRRILETAPDAIVVVGPSGTIEYANAQTERLFGHPRALLVGQTIDVLLPARLRRAHGRHVERFFTSPTPRPMGSGLELYGARADGTEFPIEVSLSPVSTDDGLLVSAAIRDISERRAMEALGREHAERLAAAVESLQEAVAVYDRNDRLVVANAKLREILSPYIRGSLIGRPFTEILEGWLAALSFADDDERERYRATRLNERRTDGGTADVRTHDGRTLRITTRRMPDGGMVKTLWDRTDDMRREDEIRQARLAAEAGSAAKSEFLSSMSHELRTPLNAVLGFAQLLQRDRREPLSPRHLARVEQILRGGEHLLRLIDDVLDLSRIEAGRVSISVEPVGVGDVLAEIRSTLEPLAAKANVSLEVPSPPPDTPMIAVDRTRFAQVLMNFGSNAIKYNRAGGRVSVDVSRPRADVVHVAVTDTGMGIAAEQQPKLFQPFQRAGQEAGPIEGTGIGLAITKRLAALMHAEVGFESQAGVGSTFWIDVPVHAARPLAAESIAAPRELPPHGAKTVLYVEDNPANVAFLRDLVEQLDDVTLVTCGTAEEGVARAAELQPSVVLMDINLPGMSGHDALRALRASPRTSAIPVIAITAAALPKERAAGLEAGFFRYLTKPLRVDELLAALEVVFTEGGAP